MPRDIPMHERPISERYRIAGKVWAAARRTYRGYDERKKIVFGELTLALLQLAQDSSQRMTKAQAELEALTSPQWKRYVDEMLDAEHQMNLADIEKKAIEMEHWEQKDESANVREERRSIRMGG